MTHVPLHIQASHAILPPADIATLFGADYRWRGTERVAWCENGQVLAKFAVTQGATGHVFLDGLDAAKSTGKGVYHLRGPKGQIACPAPQRLERRLVLTREVARAWGLPEHTLTTVGVGTVIFRAVPVHHCQQARFELDRADALVAEATPQTLARWLRTPIAWADDPSPQTLAQHVITEHDIRQAHRRKQKIVVQENQLITPAAQQLGKELNIFLKS